MNSGIYQIMNMRNHHMYIGSTADFVVRWSAHRRLLRRGLHCNLHLQRAWNKDGEDLFEFSVVEYTDRNSKILAVREQYYTDLWNPEYAIRKECVTSMLGVPRSEETKQKMRITALGNKNAAGCVRSEETKEQIRQKLLGVKHSEERKANESKAHIGIKPSEENRQKRSKAMSGHQWSDETNRKRSFSMMGKNKEKHSEARNSAHSEATKKWWAERKNEVL